MSATRELQYIQRYRCWTHSDVDRERRAGRSAVCLQVQGPDIVRSRALGRRCAAATANGLK